MASIPSSDEAAASHGLYSNSAVDIPEPSTAAAAAEPASSPLKHLDRAGGSSDEALDDLPKGSTNDPGEGLGDGCGDQKPQSDAVDEGGVEGVPNPEGIGAEVVERKLIEEQDQEAAVALMNKRTESKAMVGGSGTSDLMGKGPGDTMNTQVVAAEKEEPSKEAGKETVKQMTAGLDDQRARYYLPPQEDKAAFALSDLVWGKVKNHPWWPGEIFHPSHSSEMAMKNQKEGKLIAYFGDRSFAWNEERHLKPFFEHFTQMEKQRPNSLGAFAEAVDAALGEVERRVELGMTCSCFADEAYAEKKYQKIDNTGIREGTCSSAVDGAWFVSSFDPKRMLDFMEALAQFPSGGADRLDLVIAKAQVKAFYCSKGHPELPAFVDDGRLVQDDSVPSPSRTRRPGKSESKGKAVSWSSTKKRKVADYGSPHSEKRNKKSLRPLGDLETLTWSPRSVKVGERISRVARQMTESPPVIKTKGETKSAAMVDPSMSEILSQLCSTARDPVKWHSFLPTLTSFFTDFRASFPSSSSKECEEELATSGRKRKGKSQSRGRKKKMKPAGEDPSLSLPSDTMLDAAQGL